MSSGVGQEAKQSMVSATLEKLNRVVKDVEDRAKGLEVRLEVVLRNVPSAEAPNMKEEKSFSSLLVSDLEGYVNRLANVVESVNSIIDRLDL